MTGEFDDLPTTPSIEGEVIEWREVVHRETREWLGEIYLLVHPDRVEVGQVFALDRISAGCHDVSGVWEIYEKTADGAWCRRPEGIAHG